ncbi:hypothetical protein D3C72_1523280 [compost metagenome]
MRRTSSTACGVSCTLWPEMITFSDSAPGRCELQYGTSPSSDFSTGSSGLRWAMIEWYFRPGVIGSCAAAFTNGSLALRLSMLLGIFGLAVPSTCCSACARARNTSSNLPRMVSGRRTRRPIRRPTLLPAISVPWCGAAMKIARSTFGSALKCSSGPSLDCTRFRRSPFRS